MLVDNRRWNSQRKGVNWRKRWQLNESGMNEKLSEMKEKMATLLHLVSESGLFRGENSCKWRVESSEANGPGQYQGIPCHIREVDGGSSQDSMGIQISHSIVWPSSTGIRNDAK